MHLFIVVVIVAIIYIFLDRNNKEHFKWGKGIPFGNEYVLEPVNVMNAQDYINLMNQQSDEFDLNDPNEFIGAGMKNKYNQTCSKGCSCDGSYINLSPMIFPRGTSYYYYPL